MNLGLHIARRYFLSRKKKTFINVISVISMLVVGTSTMALVIVLSVFNGLEGLLRNLYGSFDAHLTVQATEGKTFEYTEELKSQILSLSDVLNVVEVIEDNALIKYKNSQRVARLKGVSDNMMLDDRFKEAITLGDIKLKEDSVGYAIVGRGIHYSLSLQLMDDTHPMVVYYPRNIDPGVTNPDRMFTQIPIIASSSFAIEKYLDDNYVFVPIEFMQELLGHGTARTSLELSVTPNANLQAVKSSLQGKLGDGYQVKLNEELRGSLYRILRWEKIFVFLTFGIIIAIGSINIYFSLSMLVIDKRKDFAILKSFGADKALLTRIVFYNGTMIAFIGAFSGLLLGLLIVGLQQQFGWVTMGVQGAISNSYPVKIVWPDILLTVLLVVVVTVLASIQPAIKASRSLDLSQLQ